MVQAIEEDRPLRASGRLALHVLETADASVRSSREGRAVELEGELDPVDPLPA